MTASLVKPGWRARVTGVANALLRPRRLVAIFIILFLLDFLNILPLVFVLSRWLIIPRVCQQLEFDPLNQQHLSGAALSRLSIQQYSVRSSIYRHCQVFSLNVAIRCAVVVEVFGRVAECVYRRHHLAHHL
jgi:hypothetical protein